MDQSSTPFVLNVWVGIEVTVNQQIFTGVKLADQQTKPWSVLLFFVFN